MELRQLEYFRALCKELHFSKAAESIGISQPTLSQQIKVLEEEMELPLFDRLGKRIAITEAGQVLYEQCEEIFQRIEYVKDYFSEMRTQERGRLRVGVIPGAVDLLLGQMVADYHSAYPEVSLAILGSTRVVDQVLQSEADLGIAMRPAPDERLMAVPLYEDEMILAVAADHPYAVHDILGFEDIKNMKTVMLTSDHQCRQLVNEHCRKLGFQLMPHIETSNSSSLIKLIRSGVGASIVSRVPMEILGLSDIKLIPLSGPRPQEEICLIYRKDKFIGNAGRSFIRMLNDTVKTKWTQAPAAAPVPLIKANHLVGLPHKQTVMHERPR